MHARITGEVWQLFTILAAFGAMAATTGEGGGWLAVGAWLSFVAVGIVGTVVSQKRKGSQ